MSSDGHEKSRRTRSKRVTLADVARRAGVSQTAASFVLSGRGEEMRYYWDSSHFKEIVGDFVRLARRALETRQNVYLFNLV